jgi:hypothetical protein
MTVEEQQEILEILKPLWSGESIFCTCGHHLYQHFNNEFPEELIELEGYPSEHCFYKAAGGTRCQCTEFQSSTDRADYAKEEINE